jgi:hypothetical protein
LRNAYPLGPDIIHSVTNLLSRLIGTLQVYGGDLYGVIGSEWDSETLCEQRVQAAPSVQLFEAANAAMRVQQLGLLRLCPLLALSRH